MRVILLACIFTVMAAVSFCLPDRANAQASDAVRQACTPDAMRLCSDVIPDVPKVTACMKAKSRQLSQAWLSCRDLAFIQAVTFGTSGITSEQSRIASGVHACRTASLAWAFARSGRQNDTAAMTVNMHAKRIIRMIYSSD